MRFKKTVGFLLALALLVSLAAGLSVPVSRAAPGDPYMDPSLPIEVRVADLLGRMTQAEKAGQMVQVEKGASTGYIRDNFIGSVLSGGGGTPGSNTPQGWVNMIYGFQTAALQTRLGIPILYEVDAVHGNNNAAGATIFPHNNALGCTNNEELVREIGRATAVEMRAAGIPGNFAPCAATPLNIRWGRTYEGFSSDYDITARLSAAYVEGLQGGRPADASALNTDAAHPNQYAYFSGTTAIATMKHYLAEGLVPGAGPNKGNARISTLPSNLAGMTPAQLRADPAIAELLGPYEEMIEAGARSLMPSFSSVNGTRMVFQKELMDIVKLPKAQGGLGFTGFVISDWDDAGDTVRAVKAGIDMIMCSGTGGATGAINALKNTTDSVLLARMDDAVTRILRVKFELGLFEDPMPNTSELQKEIFSQKHQDLARQAVRESAVLLKNDNDVVNNLKNAGNVLVTGRFADNMGYQCGGWTISWQGVSGNGSGIAGTTILGAVRNKIGASKVFTNANGALVNGGNIDAVLVCVGETPYAEGDGDNRYNLALESADMTAFNNAKTNYPGKPVILLTVTGRPMVIKDVIDRADAVVACWWFGSMAEGIADLLFDDNCDFTGVTSMPWPRNLTDIGAADTNGKIIEPTDLIYPFGYGLQKGTGVPTPVDDITDLSEFVTVGAPLTLTGTVVPRNATNKAIAWSIADAGLTGASLSGNILNTSAVGNVTVRATIEDGLLDEGDFTKDFVITVNPFIAVTDIIDVPASTPMKTPLTLTGTVVPGNAAAQAITWSIKDAGLTGASLIGNALHTTSSGLAVVTARVAGGLAGGLDFTKDFMITVEQVASDESIALKKPIKASYEQSPNTATCANDGTDYYWSSYGGGFDHWIEVDLGDDYYLTQEKINWFTAASRTYRYELWGKSGAGNNWGNVAKARDFAAEGYTKLVDKTAEGYTETGVAHDVFPPGTVARYLVIKVTSAVGATAGAITDWTVHGWRVKSAEYTVDEAAKTVTTQIPAGTSPAAFLSKLSLMGNGLMKLDSGETVQNGDKLSVTDIIGGVASYTLDLTFAGQAGVTITGLVKSYNPNNPAALKLMQGGEEKYSTTIVATPGFGQMDQSFAFTNVAPGTYTLVITKPAHTSFTVQTVAVGDTDLDLTQDSRDAVKVMTLLCGDINGDQMINDNDLIVLWQAANYNKNVEQAANPLCDLNGDGVINDNDLIILWLAVNYNKGPVVVP